MLVAVLVVVFVGVLFIPALSDYFGLTGPASPVFTTVLPALVIWFLALTAAYRFQLLERILGLDRLAPGPLSRQTGGYARSAGAPEESATTRGRLRQRRADVGGLQHIASRAGQQLKRVGSSAASATPSATTRRPRSGPRSVPARTIPDSSRSEVRWRTTFFRSLPRRSASP